MNITYLMVNKRVRERPLYQLLRKIVESDIGAPVGRVNSRQNVWFKIPYIPPPISRFFILFSPIQGKTIELEKVDKSKIKGIKVNPEKLRKRKQILNESTKKILERFEQKKTQYPHFDLGLKMGLLFSKYHELTDVHASSEVTLHIPTRNGKSLEIGRRDIFIHGRKGDRRVGISIEIESKLDRSSIRKFLYALHDTLHINFRGEFKEVSLLRHIIVTKDISGYVEKMLNLRKFEDPEDIDGVFDIPTVFRKISKNHVALGNLIETLSTLEKEDPEGILIHFAEARRDFYETLSRLRRIEKKLDAGKALTYKDKETITRTLEILREYNIRRHAISFEVTLELVRELIKDKKFMSNLVNCVSARPFPISLKIRVMKAWKRGEFSEVLLKDVLDYLAGEIRKTLERTVILHAPEIVSKGGKRSVDLDNMRIIWFERVGKEYRLIPRIMTVRDYLDKLTIENLKEHAKYIDKQIRKGKVRITMPR